MAQNALTRLVPCPKKPNCISTLAAGPRQHMDPIPYTGTREAAKRRLLAVLHALGRTVIVADEGDYLHAECRSQLFRFVDDVELVLDDAAKVIHFRSAARTGSYDFGVNRKRMETIRRDFLAQR